MADTENTSSISEKDWGAFLDKYDYKNSGGATLKFDQKNSEENNKLSDAQISIEAASLFNKILAVLTTSKHHWGHLKTAFVHLLTAGNVRNSFSEKNSVTEENEQPFSIIPHRYQLNNEDAAAVDTKKMWINHPVSWVNQRIQGSVSKAQAAIVSGADVFGIKVEDNAESTDQNLIIDAHKPRFFSAICQPDFLGKYAASLEHFIDSVESKPMGAQHNDDGGDDSDTSDLIKKHVLVFGKNLFSLHTQIGNQKSQNADTTSKISDSLGALNKRSSENTEVVYTDSKSHLKDLKGGNNSLFSDLDKLALDITNHIDIVLPVPSPATGAIDVGAVSSLLNNAANSENWDVEKNHVARFFATYTALKSCTHSFNRLVLAVTCFYYANGISVENKRDIHLLTPHAGSDYRHYRKVMDSVSLAIHRFTKVKYAEKVLQHFHQSMNEQLDSKGYAEPGHGIEALGKVAFPRHVTEKSLMRILFVAVLAVALFFSAHLAIPAIVAIIVGGLGVYGLVEALAQNRWNQVDASKYEHCDQKLNFISTTKLTASEYQENCEQRFKLLWQVAGDHIDDASSDESEPNAMASLN